MNRPFPAFAALLVLMTLAVVALSTSSRSTTVGPAPRRKAALVKQPTKGGPSFVFVVAGAASNEESDDDHAAADTSVIGGIEDTLDAFGKATSRLKSTSVCVVEPVVGMTSHLQTPDGRSHYDSIIDGDSISGMRELANTSGPLSTDELLLIFDQFGARKSARSVQHNGTVTNFHDWFRSSRVAAAARLWLIQQLRRLVDELPLFSSVSVDGVDELVWSEYADLIDRAVNESKKNSPANFNELQRTAVQFGDWMRYSAAASLSNLLAAPSDR